MQHDDNDFTDADGKRRTVAGAHFFHGGAHKGTVSYLLNEGYCNIQCPHCYVNRIKTHSLRRNPQQAQADIENLKAQGYRVLLRGTEIIIHDDFIPLFKVAEQDYVQTNGLQIARHPQVLTQLWDSGVRYIIISYPFDSDGMVDMDPNESDQAISLSAQRFGVTVALIVTRSVVANLSRLCDFCEHVRSLGARAVKFVRLIPVTPDLLPLTPTPEESREALLEIATLKKRYKASDLILQTPGCFGLFEFRRALDPERFEAMDLSEVYDCPAGIKNFVIDLNNDIYPCLYLMAPEHKIGRFTGQQLLIESAACIPGGLRKCECPAYSLRAPSAPPEQLHPKPSLEPVFTG